MLLPLRMNRRDLTVFVLSTVALVVIGVRLLAPAALTRQISVEAIDIQSAPIKSGETLTQEASWIPPDDTFIVGWSPDPGAPGALPELYLMYENTAVFLTQRASIEGLKPVFFPAGSGFKVRKGVPVKLRLQLKNSGPDGETKGARALVYFHPVAWR